MKWEFGNSEHIALVKELQKTKFKVVYKIEFRISEVIEANSKEEAKEKFKELIDAGDIDVTEYINNKSFSLVKIEEIVNEQRRD